MLNPKSKVVPLHPGDIVVEENAAGLALGEGFQNGDGPRPFPTVSTLPRLPVMIPDEILDYYGWLFCQGGFHNLQMTFEQFLTVVATIKPTGLCPEYDEVSGAPSAS